MFWQHHLRLILSTVALFFGGLVLLISLAQDPTSVLSADGQYQASQRQLYLGQEILPDHVAYPLLMTIDRVKLESQRPVERVYTQLDYASRRLEYAKLLLDKGNQSLALTTATKGEKYLLHAGQEALDQDLDPSVKRAVWLALEYHTKELHSLKDRFSADADRAVLDQLLTEGQVMSSRLQSVLPTDQPAQTLLNAR